jgi:hypothetical protein
MIEPKQDPEGPKFVRRIRRPARSPEPIHPEPSPAPSPAPAKTRRKTKRQPVNEASPTTSASQQLLDAMQQVRDMQQVVRQVQEAKAEHVPFWKQHGILITAVLMLAGFYLYQRWQPASDKDDVDEVVTVIERLPETLQDFYAKDQSSKAKILRDISTMEFPDDPAKLKWFNDQSASRLAEDSKPVIDDLAEIIHSGKTLEAAEALEQ